MVRDAGFQADEGMDTLSRNFVSGSDDGSLGDGLVHDEGGFDLGGGEAMSRDVDDVVDTAADPDVAVLVAGGTVAGEIVAWVGLQVGLEVTVVVSVDCASNGRPGLLDGQDTRDVVALEFLTGDGVEDGDVDSKEGDGCRSGLCGDGSRKRGDNMAASFGLPVGVDDCAAALSDLVVVPVPGFGVDGFSDGTQDAEGREVVAFDPLVAETTESADGGWGGIELGDLVFCDELPVAGGGWVCGDGLEEDGGGAEGEGSIDDVRVSGDPTDVGHAGKDVVRVVIKDILDRRGSAEQVTRGGMHDSLGLTSRSRSVKQKQGVLRVHRLRGEVVHPLGALLSPPEIPSFLHGDLGTSTLADNDGLNRGARLERLINNLLCLNRLATTFTLVRSNDKTALSVLDTVTEGFRRETGKDDTVQGTDTGTGEEGNDGLGDHGHVDGDGIALLDSAGTEGSGQLADLAEELAVCDVLGLVGLVCFVNNSDLLGYVRSKMRKGRGGEG